MSKIPLTTTPPTDAESDHGPAILTVQIYIAVTVFSHASGKESPTVNLVHHTLAVGTTLSTLRKTNPAFTNVVLYRNNDIIKHGASVIRGGDVLMPLKPFVKAKPKQKTQK